MPTLPIQFGSPTPVIITDVSGSSGTSANIPVVDAATGAVNSTAPVYAEQIGWLDAGGKLQAVSAANPLPISGSTAAAAGLFSIIQLSATGTVVAAVGGKQIRVVAGYLMANGTVNVKFQSHVAGDITGLSYLVSNTGLVLPYNPIGWFQTTVSEALDLNLSASIAVGGSLVYLTV